MAFLPLLMVEWEILVTVSAPGGRKAPSLALVNPRIHPSLRGEVEDAPRVASTIKKRASPSVWTTSAFPSTSAMIMASLNVVASFKTILVSPVLNARVVRFRICALAENSSRLAVIEKIGFSSRSMTNGNGLFDLHLVGFVCFAVVNDKIQLLSNLFFVLLLLRCFCCGDSALVGQRNRKSRQGGLADRASRSVPF